MQKVFTPIFIRIMESFWNYTQDKKGIQSGNRFKDAFDDALRHAHHLDIITGYVGKNQCNDYSSLLYDKTTNGGRVRVLVGMAGRDSLSKSTYDPWRELDVKLRQSKTNSGIFSFQMPIHSKVYLTYDKLNKPVKTFVGSSNFNFSTPNMECTVDIPNCSRINKFVKDIFLNPFLIDFEQVLIRGTKRDPLSKSSKNVPILKPSKTKFDSSKLLLADEINLREICRKNPISSLNLYHGAGRKINNKWTPRTWYEIEITLNKQYLGIPRDFTAFTDDGYELVMQRRAGAKKGKAHLGMKDLTSKNNRRIFGHWLKGKLEKNNVLDIGDVINDETFDRYGNDTLKFYKIDETKMFIEF